ITTSTTAPATLERLNTKLVSTTTANKLTNPTPYTLRTSLRPSSPTGPSPNTKTPPSQKTHRKSLKGGKHAHNEGSRKRWQDTIPPRERKRYEAVWASNRGSLLSQPSPTSSQGINEDENDFVANIVVRNIWRRSRLTDEELAEVWDLVDRRGEGVLSRVEFVLYAWTKANLSPHPSTPQQPPSTSTSTSTSPSIYILGAGNIGRLFATSLAALPSKPTVTLVVRTPAQLQTYLSSPGIQLVKPSNSPSNSPSPSPNHTSQITLESWTETPPQTGPIHQIPPLKNLIIATKITNASDATLSLRRYLTRDSTIAMAQNGICPFWPPQGNDLLIRGWGSVEEAPTIMACVVSHGLYADPSRGAGTSVHAALGDVVFGPVCGAALSEPSIAEESFLARCLVSAEVLDAKTVCPTTLWLSQLEKLVYNSTINPLTALIRCPNGALLTTETRRQVVDKLLCETSLILRTFIAHRAPLHLPNTTPSFSAADLRARLEAFIPRVGPNRSSMLQHVVAGVPTEIRAFNGWLVDRAAELGLGSGSKPVLHRKLVNFVEKAKPDDEPWDDDMLRRMLL
ncbi:hypothetical protein CP533_5247, partial [Ophiocordyceps camponoti-saundersi (nom. inval.)]